MAKGFNSYSVKLKENTKLVAVNLKLKPSTKAREYAIGYGYVKDLDRLNAMSQINSLTLSSAALIVVDGIPVDKSALYSLVPSNVSSINILKYGSAAIYGSRGANGVVLIETKRGGEN